MAEWETGKIRTLNPIAKIRAARLKIDCHLLSLQSLKEKRGKTG